MALGESRIQSEFTSDQNVTYKLSIYDSNLAFPATNSVTAGADGFTLTYDGDHDWETNVNV